MCELLGISVSPPAQLGVYFRELRPRAENNKEGWGVAWWDGDRVRLVKEPVRADQSEQAAALAADPPTSGTFIVHVRAATVGEPTVSNTHPFTAKALGRRWVFGHNGTVKELDRLDEGALVCEGDTDSERSFHHLLTRLESVGREASDERVAEEVLAAGRELSERDSRVNFLLSDGRTLFAYHDGHKTLHYLERTAGDLGEIGMADDDYRLSLRTGDAPGEHAVIVATVPLTDEPGWTKLDAGDFLVIQSGRVVERVALSPR